MFAFSEAEVTPMERGRVGIAAAPRMSELDILSLHQADHAAVVSPWTSTVDPRYTRSDDC
jgi:hypothetical protein